MWKRTAQGRELHFYLAGINNQNFLMRDHETGSWWQQVTGRAIVGPMAGTALELEGNDELSFGLWKSEQPNGLVLAPVAGHEKDYDENWEKEVASYSVPVSFSGQGMRDRDVVLGVEMNGEARAFPIARVQEPSPVMDKAGGVPLVLVTATDGVSVRVFRAEVQGTDLELYRDPQSDALVDTHGNTWNFAGCAVSGPAAGQCLVKVNFLKDFWFDRKNYHPQTTVYTR